MRRWAHPHYVLILLARVLSRSMQYRLQPCVQNLNPPCTPGIPDRKHAFHSPMGCFPPMHCCMGPSSTPQWICCPQSNFSFSPDNPTLPIHPFPLKNDCLDHHHYFTITHSACSCCVLSSALVTTKCHLATRQSLCLLAFTTAQSVS